MTPPYAGLQNPTEGAALNVSQAGLDPLELIAIMAAIQGYGVVSGCAVTAQGVPDMTVAVAAGKVHAPNVGDKIVAAGNVAIAAADNTNPRFDLVVAAYATGAVSVLTGAPAAAADVTHPGPVWPVAFDPLTYAVLAEVYVPAGVASIGATQIVDKRPTIATPAQAVQVSLVGAVTFTSQLVGPLLSGTFTPLGTRMRLKVSCCSTNSGKAWGHFEINYGQVAFPVISPHPQYISGGVLPGVTKRMLGDVNPDVGSNIDRELILTALTPGVPVNWTVTCAILSGVDKDTPLPGAWGIVVTPDGKKIYCSCRTSNQVAVIIAGGSQGNTYRTNPSTQYDPALKTFIAVGNLPQMLAVSPDGTKVIVANDVSVSIINTATDTLQGTYALPGSGVLASTVAIPGKTVVTDGVTTNGSTTVSSAAAGFGATDVGRSISGAGIPAATTIASVTNATTVVISAAATATAAGVSLTVDRSDVAYVADFNSSRLHAIRLSDGVWNSAIAAAYSAFGTYGLVLGLSTTIDVSMNTLALPQPTINIGATAGFPAAGTAVIQIGTGFTTVSYTGTTATSLTGCTGGTGTLATGQIVTTSRQPSYGCALPNGTEVYIPCYAAVSTVYVLNVATGALTLLTTPGANTRGFSCSFVPPPPGVPGVESPAVWVVQPNAQTLQEILTSTHAMGVTSVALMSAGATFVAIDPQGWSAWVSFNNGNVEQIWVANPIHEGGGGITAGSAFKGDYFVQADLHPPGTPPLTSVCNQLAIDGKGFIYYPDSAYNRVFTYPGAQQIITPEDGHLGSHLSVVCEDI